MIQHTVVSIYLNLDSVQVFEQQAISDLRRVGSYSCKSCGQYVQVFYRR